MLKGEITVVRAIIYLSKLPIFLDSGFLPGKGLFISIRFRTICQRYIEGGRLVQKSEVMILPLLIRQESQYRLIRFGRAHRSHDQLWSGSPPPPGRPDEANRISRRRGMIQMTLMINLSVEGPLYSRSKTNYNSGVSIKF